LAIPEAVSHAAIVKLYCNELVLPVVDEATVLQQLDKPKV